MKYQLTGLVLFGMAVVAVWTVRAQDGLIPVPPRSDPSAQKQEPANLPAPAPMRPIAMQPTTPSRPLTRTVAMQPGPPSPEGPPQRQLPAPSGPGRDPTRVNPELQPLLDPPTRVEGANNEELLLEVRGRIVTASGRAYGVLRINDMQTLVKEGKKIRHNGTTIIVKAFNADEVVVVVDETGHEYHLR
ncbi:hypothetical protein [Anatilimnocola floriformis]|uniref:hypothetical protein n=1 Tax=Anatilimnocola floriformis TaxID=2948575 RepID=UPI0020C5AB75|nr:hypothetical protein [Anatilimnocola floriformis]